MCFVVIVLRYWNNHLNRENAKVLARLSEAESEDLRAKLAFADASDRQNPFFVYTR